MPPKKSVSRGRKRSMSKGRKRRMSKGRKRSVSKGRKRSVSKGHSSGKKITVGFYLKHDTTGQTRSPSSPKEINFVNNHTQNIVKNYAKPGFSVKKLGKRGIYYVMEVTYVSNQDPDIVPDLLVDPDDDGNYYIDGVWGWHAKRL